MARNPWTKEQLAFLRDRGRDMGLQALTEALNAWSSSHGFPMHSRGAIRQKRHELGIRMTDAARRASYQARDAAHGLMGSSAPVELVGLEAQTHAWLSRRRRDESPPTLTEIADHLGVPPRQARETIDGLMRAGYRVVIGEDSSVRLSRSSGPAMTHIHDWHGDRTRFGVISDAHLGSIHAHESGLDAVYARFGAEKVRDVYACGNMLEGSHSYPGQEYELKPGMHGVSAQVAYFVERFPRVAGVTTHLLCSSTCHEGGWYTTRGLEVGRLIERERTDIRYCGLDEADFWIGKHKAARLRLLHPGGGSAYAMSYKPQKIIESLDGGDKPHMLVVGHYHKAGFFDWRNVHIILAGCLQWQTPFMRKRQLAAHVGAWIVEAVLPKEGGLTSLKVEWMPFYHSQISGPKELVVGNPMPEP